MKSVRLVNFASVGLLLMFGVGARAASTVIADTNNPIAIPRTYQLPVASITDEIAGLVCEGITVVKAEHDFTPTFHDGNSEASAHLKLDRVGTYYIHFDHPDGSNQPPVRLVVTPRSEPVLITNTFLISQDCPKAITNRQGDTLKLEWRGSPGRGTAAAGWFFRGITSTAASSPAYAVKYISWSGFSPGAGYTHTILTAVEVDLAKSRMRKVSKSSRQPQPMLPADDRGISELLAGESWTNLSRENVIELGRRVQAWLATSPPEAYDVLSGLGREDGQRTELTVSWATNSITTHLARPTSEQSRVPPKEWRELIESMTGGVSPGF